HKHGSPGHGRDHLLPALLPPYASVPVIDGQLMLGTWQSICLVDTNHDNPVRTVRLTFLVG
ncbi:MAG: YjbQ family protein, partial [Pseudonocardiaceae bacterium]